MAAARRFRAEWALVLLVTAVATLTGALIASLSLVLAASEQHGVRTALAAIPAEQAAVDVRLLHPTASIASTRAVLPGAVSPVLGDMGSLAQSGFSLSVLGDVGELGPDPAVAYLGELDDVAAHVTLVSGVWPAAAETSSAGVPVVVPEPAADALGLELGTPFAFTVAGIPTTLLVAGVYRSTDADESFWGRDLLHGSGFDPQFSRPDTSFYLPLKAFGPLLPAAGAIDAADIPVDSVDVEFRPEFSSATAAQLTPLLARLGDADIDVPTRAGNIAQNIYYSSRLGDGVAAIAAALVVTRSSVVVVSLLLLMLAVIAAGQAARLLTSLRTAERQLIRARGAGARSMLALAAIEAGAVGLIVTAVGPLLAKVGYRVLAAQPPMVAAGLPPDARLSVTTWLIAAAVAVVFGVVLVFRQRPPRWLDSLPGGREHRLSGFLRSGMDIGLLAIAVVGYWQLRRYRTPTVSDASLGVDPVVVAGPAIALLAGVLACVRVLPMLVRVVEFGTARSRGIVVALAGWEVGRRTQRATAAVVLFSLSLAVGAFCLTFLATWRQAQLDSAAVAVGPPVRVAVDTASAGAQSRRLEEGAVGSPQPVVHRSARLTRPASGEEGDSASPGVAVQVLGLPAAARDLLNRGRPAAAGGAQTAAAFDTSATSAEGVLLPPGARQLSASVQISAPPSAADPTTADPAAADAPTVDATAVVRFIIEDGNGLLSDVVAGDVPVDGAPHTISAAVTPGPADVAADPLRFLGFQVSFASEGVESSRPADIPLTILLGDLGTADAGSSTPVAWAAAGDWFGSESDGGKNATVEPPPAGWQLALGAMLPKDLQNRSATFTLASWSPVVQLPAVIQEDFAQSYAVARRAALTLLVGGAAIPLVIVDRVALVPGAAPLSQLAAPGVASAAADSNTPVVVDGPLLARALIQAGVGGDLVDEWWVDVPSGAGQQYLDRHEEAPAVSADVYARQLQESPLRVGTQIALELAVAAGGVFAIAGFGAHVSASLRGRRLESAHLQAIGLSRRRVNAANAVEYLLLGALGALLGVGLGLLVVRLIGPLITASADGTPTATAVLVDVPWGQLGELVLVVAGVLTAVVTIMSSVHRTVSPGTLLRGGAQ